MGLCQANGVTSYKRFPYGIDRKMAALKYENSANNNEYDLKIRNIIRGTIP